jgi:hypothetical protein
LTIRLAGSTSGYTELDSPAVGANNTLTLPSGAPAVAGASMVGDASGNLSFSTALTASSLNGGPLAGFRNRIINGLMTINQRGFSSLSSGLNTVTYFVDRWFGFATGAAVNLSFVGTGFRVTGAAGNIIALMGQRIEATNSADLAGSTVTLSFLAASSNNASLNWRVSYAGSADNFGLTTTSNSGTVSTTSSVTRYTATFTLNGAATTGVQIELFVNNFTSGTFDIAQVQLEPGPVATPFERRPIGAELVLCQRYFAVIYVSLRGTSISGNLEYTAKFPQTMRAIPSATGFSHPGYVALNVSSETLRQWSSSEMGYGINGTANTDMYVLGRGYILSAEL